MTSQIIKEPLFPLILFRVCLLSLTHRLLLLFLLLGGLYAYWMELDREVVGDGGGVLPSWGELHSENLCRLFVRVFVVSSDVEDPVGSQLDDS